MKIDPYKHEERYISWKNKVKEKGIPQISKVNSDLILDYLNDMENGINISSSSIKGSRSYIRLNTLKERMIFFSKKFKEYYDLNDITQINEEQLITFFSQMKKGSITRKDGKRYQSTGDYIKVFKAFWNWWIKINRKKDNKIIQNITIDLDIRDEKPKWVYLTEEQIKLLCDSAKYEYKVLMMFLYDSGIRSPTELINIKVSDFYNNFSELEIREEISKTFGRRIKLMLCSDLIKRYIEDFQIKDDDYLFTTLPCNVNRYLKNNARKILGEGLSLAGQRYSELTMYDFRHCSCCYWLPRYKSESALKYRFGWKKSDKIHYYSELLGMRDTISEDDLLTPDVKTEVEKELVETKNENSLLKEELIALQEQMKEIFSQVTKLSNNSSISLMSK